MSALLDADIAFDYPLAQKTSMRVGGKAAAATRRLNRSAGIVAALSFCESEHIAWTMIGLGSNLLVPDEGFPGLVLRLAGEFVKIASTVCAFAPAGPRRSSPSAPRRRQCRVSRQVLKRSWGSPARSAARCA